MTAATVTGPAAEPGAADHGTQADALGAFLAQLGRWPLLSAQAEVELARRVERGDLQAKEQLVCANLRLVVNLARRFQQSGLPLGDLIQEGTLGLIRAAEKFDYRRGYRFSTYATIWIRQALQRGVFDKGRAIRLPVNVAQRDVKIAKARRRLELELGAEPDAAQVARATGLSEAEVQAMDDISRVTTSLDRPVGADDAGATIGQLIADDAPGVEAQALDAERARTLAGAVAQLPEPLGAVVGARFGLAGREPASLAELARQMGVPAHQISRMERQALDELSRERALVRLQAA